MGMPPGSCLLLSTRSNVLLILFISFVIVQKPQSNDPTGA